MTKKYVSFFLFVAFILYQVADIGVKGFWFWDDSSGFEAINSVDYPEYDATLTVYEHKKTGATVAHWKNRDINRAFELTFRTPTLDDTGVNHVLEHCICSGSRKYPDKNLLFKVINQTCNTFMNAFTEVDKTSYIAASLSDKQLLGFLDMFMDSVFHPLVESDRMIFEREAYRLQQKDIDSEITETGTVYNEMIQIFSDINSVSQMNSLKNLYPNSSYSCVPGGDPENIRELTYEHLMDTWKTYYHPSNMFISLYGDLNTDKFLRYIDRNYLCNYSKEKIDLSKSNMNCKTSLERKKYDFPVEENGSTFDNSIEIIAYSIDDMDNISTSELNTLALSFCNEGSYFKKELEKEIPDVNISVCFVPYGGKNIFEFVANGVKNSDFEKFEDIVQKSVSMAAKEGFSDDIIKIFDKNNIANMCAKRMEKRNMRFGCGIYIVRLLSSNWALYRDVFSGFENDSKVIDNDILKYVVNKAILNNSRKSTTITSPKKGLLEENKRKRREELDNLKFQMSGEELQGLIEKTKKFEQWSNEEPSENAIKKLQLMKVNDLSVNVPQNRAVRQFINDLDFVTIPTDDELLYSGSIIFDTSELSKEEYYISRLLTSFIGETNTIAHSKCDIRNMVSKQVFMPLAVHINFNKDGKNHTGILCSWTGKADNYLSDLELIKELIIDVDLHDYDNIRSCMAKLEINFKNNIVNNAYGEMLKRGKYFCDKSRTDMEKQFDFSFYKFLEKARKEFDDNHELFISKVEKVRKIVFSRKNVIIGVEGKPAFINGTQEEWLELADKFYNPIEINEFKNDRNDETTEVKAREAFNVGGNVQFNGMVFSCGNVNLMNSGSREVLANILNDKYLIPNIRHKLGAYFCNMFFDGSYMILMSGRDPGVAVTFEVFDKIPEFVRNMKITQEELDQYIIKAYYNIIYYNINYHPMSMMFDTLAGVTRRQKVNFLYEIKNTRVSDMRTFADILEKMIKNGYKFTLGSGTAIEENKEKFDKILKIDS